MLGANTIVPLRLHAPPRPCIAAASTRAGPPARSMRFSDPPAKKPSDSLSGDQNGYSAPCVPAIGSGLSACSSRSQSCGGSWPIEATKARRRPSGDSANCGLCTDDVVGVNPPVAGG